MSRVSSKSTLSPSTTGDGKTGSVDLGKKTQTSVSTGGIGVTREVANIGGMSVTTGVAVEILPVGFDISGNPDYKDPTNSSISIGGSAEVPGGVLGVGGGVTINTSTGAIEGVSIGGEVAGFGINISKSDDGFGFGLSLQIPFTPIEINLDFGFPGEQKEPTPTPAPAPTPAPTPAPAPITTTTQLTPINNNYVPDGDPICYALIGVSQISWNYYNGIPWECGGQFMSPHFGRDITSRSTTLLNVADEDEEKAVNSSLSLPPRFKLRAITEASTNAINWSMLNFPNSYFGYGAREVITGENAYSLITEGFATGWSRSTPEGVNFVEASLPQLSYTPRNTGNTKGYSAPSPPEGLIAVGKPSAINAWLNRLNAIPSNNTKAINQTPGQFSPLPQCVSVVGRMSYFQYMVNRFIVKKPVDSPSFPPFPNPPPRKEKMDECCRLNTRFLRAIYKGLGLAKFPGKLPSTIIQQIPEKGKQPEEPPQESVADWVDLFMWNFKRDDERWGQWEVQIDIEDADITKEGDQSKSIKLPNLAESIAEIEGQLLSVMTNVDALVAMQTKCLVESGMARQEAIKGYLASKAIIKYMAFKSTEIDVAVPMTFTPGAETISELVKESEGHIKGTDYTEKETLRDILLDLLQAAAVIRAVHWQRINTKTDTKSQLLGLLKGSVDLANSLTKPTSATGDTKADKFDPTQNFEDFIDSVEDGFTNSTGITDIQNPYGKSRDRRPRIRQIGDNISQAGGK